MDAVPALIQTLQNQDISVRGNAANVLGQIGEEAVDAVPALTLALQDLDPEVHQYVAWALGMIGKGAKDAVPVLIQALKDPEVRDSAAKALKKIGTPKALEAVKAYEFLQ